MPRNTGPMPPAGNMTQDNVIYNELNQQLAGIGNNEPMYYRTYPIHIGANNASTIWQPVGIEPSFDSIPQPTSPAERRPTHPDYPRKSFAEVRAMVRAVIDAAPDNRDETRLLIKYLAQRLQADGCNGTHAITPPDSNYRAARQNLYDFLRRITHVDYFACTHHINELVHPDRVYYISHDSMCGESYNEFYAECDECGEEHSRDSLTNTACDMTICHDCYTNSGYVYCEDCGEHTNSCQDCEMEGCGARLLQARIRMRNVIMDYSTDVTHQLPGFYRVDMEQKENLFFGVELEVLPRKGQSPEETAQAVKASLEQHAILKHDGSLEDGGFEIVTVPATLAYHRQKLWNGFFGDEGQTAAPIPHNKNSVSNKVKSWSANCCGLHIHFSRAALTPMQIGKFLVFMHAEENNAFLTRLAGRKVCAPTSGNHYYYTSPKRLNRRLTQNITSETHHEAASISSHTGGATVEVRIFKGNASRHGVMRALDLVAALVQYCGSTRAAGLYWVEFLAWFNRPENRGNYADLWRQLIDLKLVETEHKFRALNPDSGRYRLVRLCSELPEDEQEELAV